MTEVCKLLAILAGGGGKETGKEAESGGKGTREGKGEFTLAAFAADDDEMSAVFAGVLGYINEMASKLHALGYTAGQNDPNQAWYENLKRIETQARREARREAFKSGIK